MEDTTNRWQRRLKVHWNKNGGPIAAQLWWLAFTLTLLCLVAMSPLEQHRQHTKSGQITSLSNLKRIGVALVMYGQDYDALPPMTDLATMRRAIRGYSLDDGKAADPLWQTPKTHTPYEVNSSLSQRRWKSVSHPENIVAVWDTRAWQEKWHAVGFLDGHVKMVPLAQWETLRTQSGIVRDVRAPAEPIDWWEAHVNEKSILHALNVLLAGAGVAAFFAAWREAWHRAQIGKRFWLRFIGWFCVRFFGYGFLVFLAAATLALVIESTFFLS